MSLDDAYAGANSGTHAKLEIESKFLVRSTPNDLEQYAAQAMRQGYLAVDRDAEVRVRESADLRLTVKRGGGAARAEVEIELTREAFDALWPLTEGRRVEKTRFRIPHGESTIELDLYEGALAPLKTAEVEFDSTEAQRTFRPPAWFGADVTEDARYKNKNLALEGIPAERPIEEG